MSKVCPIIWNGSVVGYISDLKADMFDLYGDWTAEAGSITDEFIERLRSGAQLWIEIGGGSSMVLGTIEEEPIEEVNVNIRLSPED
jgi:hypothetical protein